MLPVWSRVGSAGWRIGLSEVTVKANCGSLVKQGENVTLHRGFTDRTRSREDTFPYHIIASAVLFAFLKQHILVTAGRRSLNLMDRMSEMVL